MWLYTKNGFYSACSNKDNPALIHVRSQFRGDLEHLRSVCAPYSPPEITETPCGDYRFRIDVTPECWTYFLVKESDGINYAKFKPAVRDHRHTRKECYLTVFNEMMRAGREEAWEEYRKSNSTSTSNDTENENEKE